MVKQNKTNIRNSIKDSLPPLVKSVDSYADELIKTLSNKRENQRAKQTWEWEIVRRSVAKLRDTV